MEIGDNTAQSIENQAVTGKFWCAVCDYDLDSNHICWNTDYDGLGNKCPMYGLPQA